jgi:hypothetical protein
LAALVGLIGRDVMHPISASESRELGSKPGCERAVLKGWYRNPAM